MTQTATPPPAADGTRRRHGQTRPRPAGETVPLPAAVAVRTRRVQLPWMLAAIAVVILCTVGGYYAVKTARTTESVLGLRSTVLRGQTITPADLVAVDIAPDPQLKAVPADELDSVVGKHAATDLPAGGIVPEGSFTDTPVPAAGRAIVGLVLKPSAAPTTGLVPGAAVRLVPLPASGAPTTQATTRSGSPEIATTLGQVVEVTAAADGTGTQVDVDVAAQDGPSVQLLAAQDQIAVFVISQAR